MLRFYLPRAINLEIRLGLGKPTRENTTGSPISSPQLPEPSPPIVEVTETPHKWRELRGKYYPMPSVYAGFRTLSLCSVYRFCVMGSEGCRILELRNSKPYLVGFKCWLWQNQMVMLDISRGNVSCEWLFCWQYPQGVFAVLLQSQRSKSSLEMELSICLVGGWTNLFEKYAQVNLDHFPR